ncbi:Glycosyltransferase involved in cell wall bisynthesis [Zhouia amylolytica]|uniref:Glycosyltransferase involved in cell wall bisynthesis n=1 Tax=Zhouia amylolytica TaxID=376730 RepID=A0A1I6QS65_9FLAO|nr:glycosyltransferase family 1 protein [Zhouia amylolytica]SFS55230.1 Glycosyltransferase involved in cell wall bisynthesis [Zhouia amylolytica]
MNILYIITTFEKGVGGHYYSMKSTIEALKPQINPVVVNIGRNESPIIETIDCDKYQMLYKVYNFVSIQIRLKEIINKHNIQKIHCFDDRAYLFLRSIRFKNVQLILTKCGGPNLRFYPKINTLIVYSKENYEFFRSLGKTENLYLVPNRVSSFYGSDERVKDLKTRLRIKSTENVFLRISRITKYYQKSLVQSINLVKSLETSRLIIIGQVMDEEVFEELKRIKSNKIHLVTDSLYYQNAKEIIPICDFYIGTGRGLMEASSMGKVLLSPVKDSKFPAIIKEGNFNSFFSTNFSERNKLDCDEIDFLNDIRNLLESKAEMLKLQKFSKKLFDEHFNINTKKEWYLRIYTSQLKGPNLNVLDRIKHFLIFHYHYLTQG